MQRVSGEVGYLADFEGGGRDGLVGRGRNLESPAQGQPATFREGEGRKEKSSRGL